MPNIQLSDLGHRLKVTDSPLRRMIRKAHKLHPSRFIVKKISVPGTKYKRSVIDEKDALEIQYLYAFKKIKL